MTDSIQNDENNFEKSELSDEVTFSEKLIGIITSPVDTMTAVGKYPPKASDWLVPVIIFIVISGLATFLYYSNPALKSEMSNKSYEAIDKSYQDKIDKGEITQQEADKQKEKIMSQMESAGSSQIIFQVIGIAIYVFISMLLVNGIFFLLIKFILKGEGTFSAALSAWGLSYYIIILQTLVTMILSLASDKFFVGLSLVNFYDVEWMTFSGFLLRKVDPFLIWFYAVLGISYAKMFSSEDMKKYIILTFAVWIIGNLLMYFMSTLSPIFSGFAM